jgi:hypothetical protein
MEGVTIIEWMMKRLHIIPARWHRRRAKSQHSQWCSLNRRWRQIQVLFSSTGGGGPPAGRRRWFILALLRGQDRLGTASCLAAGASTRSG